MTRLITGALLVLTLAACGKEWPDRKVDWQVACQEYGFVLTTPEMARCVQEQEQRYQAAVAQGWRNVSNALKAPPVINCRSTTYGGTTQTTCY